MRTRASAIFFATIAAGLLAASATAGGKYGAGKLGGMSSCPSMPMVQPFSTVWGDTGSYFLAPGGAFEGSLTGWAASGGAKLVNGNESYYVHSTSDKSSLYLPSGSKVTSPSVCVTNSTPDLRLFVLNTGSASATLTVNMTYTNNKGKASTVAVGSLTGGSSWSLSPQVFFLQNLTPLVNANGQTWVTFTFAPVGTTGHWQVDDFYVDPIKSQGGSKR